MNFLQHGGEFTPGMIRGMGNGVGNVVGGQVMTFSNYMVIIAVIIILIMILIHYMQITWYRNATAKDWDTSTWYSDTGESFKYSVQARKMTIGTTQYKTTQPRIDRLTFNYVIEFTANGDDYMLSKYGSDEIKVMDGENTTIYKKTKPTSVLIAEANKLGSI